MEIIPEKIKIEIIYALPDVQLLKHMHVAEGTTLGQAIALFDIAKQFPEIDLANIKFGIFGKLSKPETIMRHHDRIEIYRPLTIDPKEARRKRAAMK